MSWITHSTETQVMELTVAAQGKELISHPISNHNVNVASFAWTSFLGK